MTGRSCTKQKIQWTQFGVTHSDHCFSNTVWWFLEPTAQLSQTPSTKPFIETIMLEYIFET